MMGGIKAQFDCIKVFSETDFTDDLKTVDIPVLVYMAMMTKLYLMLQQR
jgi:hypothetical protein